MTTTREVALRTYLGISALAPEAEVLQLLIDYGVQYVGGDEGSLLVLDREKGELVFAMTSSPDDSILGQRVPMGEGLVGLAALTGEVQTGAPTYTLEGQKKPAGPREPEAVLAAPMRVGEEGIGVVTAVSFQDGKRFGAKDAKMYGRVACIAGLVVQQRQRIDALERLSSAEPPEGAPVSRDPHETSIIQSLTRLSRSPAADLAQVARLLAAVESLVGTDREV